MICLCISLRIFTDDSTVGKLTIGHFKRPQTEPAWPSPFEHSNEFGIPNWYFSLKTTYTTGEQYRMISEPLACIKAVSANTRCREGEFDVCPSGLSKSWIACFCQRHSDCQNPDYEWGVILSVKRVQTTAKRHSCLRRERMWLFSKTWHDVLKNISYSVGN